MMDAVMESSRTASMCKKDRSQRNNAWRQAMNNEKDKVVKATKVSSEIKKIIVIYL